MQMWTKYANQNFYLRTIWDHHSERTSGYRERRRGVNECHCISAWCHRCVRECIDSRSHNWRQTQANDSLRRTQLTGRCLGRFFVFSVWFTRHLHACSWRGKKLKTTDTRNKRVHLLDINENWRRGHTCATRLTRVIPWASRKQPMMWFVYTVPTPTRSKFTLL